MNNGTQQIPLPMRKPRKLTRDLTGFRSGRLLVISPSHSDGFKWHWKVKCDCGTDKTMVGSEITKGKIQSCGCAKSELISKATTKHGMSTHPAYWVWRSMNDRCRLPTHQAYHNYGGRGIFVCEEWQKSFNNFWNDMGHEWVKGLDIDRIDNSGNYEKTNCRWVPRKINNSNRRSNVYIDTPKGRMTCADACREFGILPNTLAYRLAHNWPLEKLFDQPDFRNRI